MIRCFNCGFENPDHVKFCGHCGNNIQSTSSSSGKQEADLEMLNQFLFPKFILEKKIGKGGMATVFLGEQTALQRKIVVKILNADISGDEEIRERFLLEARTPARIKHPNIVEVIDVGMCEDRPFYIMEYASGGSLSDKLKYYKEQGLQFPFKEAVNTIIKVLEALDYCHANDLQSHRDIKPANIMYRSTGEPIIVDFGIAKIADSSITRTRMTMGTANYMSPEQCQGRKDIDGRSDVYSVGIMLFELLAGDLPFKGDSGLSIMIKQVKEKLPSLNQRIKGKFDRTDPDYLRVADKVEKILETACAKSRKKRYQSAKEFAMELGTLVGTKLNITPAGHTSLQNTWGLIMAFLFLGLGIGGFLGYKVLVEKPKINIIIDTIPPGANVIDLETQKTQGTTPFTSSKTQTGVYRYKLTLNGFKEQEIEINLNDINRTESKRIDLVPEEPETPVIDNKPDIDQTLPAKKDSEVLENGLISAAGLIWQANDIRRMNWYSAVTHCKKLGMRLPSKSELKAGYESGVKALSSPCCEYWSSTPHETDQENAYNIHMGSYESFFSSKSNPFLVRCVAK
jgi:serine/threonine protein kinase